MTHSLNTNNILHEERKESELITFINELRLLANEEVLYDNKKKDEKIRERLLSRIEQNPEEIKRLLGGINRQFEADKYLLKILEQANPEKNIQHIFTTEEVSSLKIILTKITKNGKILKKPTERLSVDELRLLSKLNKSLIIKLEKSFEKLEPSEVSDLFNFAHDRGKKNEASIIGKTLKESRAFLSVISILSIILGIGALIGSVPVAIITPVVGVIILACIWVAIYKRFDIQNGWSGSDVDTIEISKTENDNFEIKEPDIFDSDVISGSTHKIKVATKMYNCIINVFDDLTIPENQNSDLLNLKNEMGNYKTSILGLQKKKCTIGLREKKGIFLNDINCYSF